jgi:DNA-binding MarR family transcriptional regulator
METKNLSAPPSLGRQLNFAAAAANAVATQLLERHDLSLAQWTILVSLWRNGPLGVKELSLLTGNAPPAISRIVDRMVEAGLLNRKADKTDRRAVTIRVTETAEGMRPLMEIYAEVNAILTTGLTVNEVDQLSTLVAKVERNGRAWVAQHKKTPGNEP